MLKKTSLLILSLMLMQLHYHKASAGKVFEGNDKENHSPSRKRKLEVESPSIEDEAGLEAFIQEILNKEGSSASDVLSPVHKFAANNGSPIGKELYILVSLRLLKRNVKIA